MSKEKDAKDAEHAVDMHEVIIDVKASANVVVWETKIKLDEDEANVGSWNLPGWCEALVSLTCKPLNINQDPEGQQLNVGEQDKIPSDDNQCTN